MIHNNPIFALPAQAGIQKMRLSLFLGLWLALRLCGKKFIILFCAFILRPTLGARYYLETVPDFLHRPTQLVSLFGV